MNINATNVNCLQLIACIVLGVVGGKLVVAWGEMVQQTHAFAPSIIAFSTIKTNMVKKKLPHLA